MSKKGVLEAIRRRAGEAGEVADAGLAWVERQHKQVMDMEIPVVSKVTEAVLQPAVLGTRAVVTNLTSGGGKYYKPEVRDERYFSEDALKDLGETVRHMKGRSSGRSDGMDNAAQFNLTQTLGGFSVKNGKVTDTFDINKSYKTVPQPLTDVARAVIGRQEDPDAGKIRTEIPLKALRMAGKGGGAAGNFLATDNVPETLFGFAIVSKDYTPDDIAFFDAHPEAGGYYDTEDTPRIVINPSTFKNKKDAMCVAFDEGFRILMEVNGFDPVAEPTDEQRKFFSDTEYSGDENMMRRTILARICTFDTSISDPTDEQLQEAVEFLDTVMEIGAPQNQWEQWAVNRIRDIVAKTLEAGAKKTP